eukprot:6497_1
MGGYWDPNALVEFDIATHSVTDHGRRAIMESETVGAAQYWSQQGPLVYIIHEEGSICFFNIYDMRTRQYTTNWKGITFLTGVGDDGCLASSALFLYVTGGDPDGIDALQVLSLTTYSWITNPLPPTMQQRRQHHSCVLHNDYLWAFAGQWTPDKKNFEIANNERILATGDIAQNTWNYIDPLTVAIESHCAVAYQDIIYVIGGRDGDLTSFDFVHLVDANTGEVTLSPDRMQSPNQYGAPIIVDSTLYLFGGFELPSGSMSTEWQYYPLDTTPQIPDSAVPSKQPTSVPSEIPIAAPSNHPVAVPSKQPTLVPSEHPAVAPVPSNQPTHVPSEIPTIGPIAVPTIHPSVAPIASPSNHPSFVPSKHPTDYNPQIHAPMPNEDATSQPTQDGFVGTSQSNYITTEASEESPLSEESEESLLFGRIVSLILWILLILAAVGMGKLCCRARARAKRDEQGMIEATKQQTNTAVSPVTAVDDTIDAWRTKQMNVTNQMNDEQGQAPGERDDETELNDTDAEESSDSENLYGGGTAGYVEQRRDQQTCTDCGVFKMGSLYDGLFYCHDCAAYYTVTPQ